MPYSDPEQRRKHKREWRARNRSNYLADKACVVCGSTERLEVDHINPAEKVSHNIWSWSKVRREAELAKCQVLCYDHHLEKTLREHYEEVAKIPHGDRRRYKRGCHCTACRKANADYRRELRRNN